MIRKLMVVSLSLLLCLALATPILAQGTYNSPGEYEQATGNKIESFSEAPMLRTMVAAGEILPLEERLPKEPLVINPVEEIGQYGGTIHLTTPEFPSDWYFNSYWLHQAPIQLTSDLEEIYPNYLKGFQPSDDYKTWTLYLREGLRWSDGAPLTADDVMFWYEDIIKNEELYPTKPEVMMHGGELAEVEKVDDYTVKFRFATTFRGFIVNYLTLPSYMYYTGTIIRPKHYLMKYHIKHNPQASELAKEEGFDHWYQLFNNMGGGAASGYTTIGRPTLEPWILKAIGPTHATFERNPYFWKIDTAGSQLPYIDRIEVKSMASVESWKMSVLGGESDFALTKLRIADFSVLKDNEEKGGYEVRLWKLSWPTAGGFFFYQDYSEDAAIAKILQDVRFRKALSLAIKREEVNKLLYFGKALPGQGFTIPPGSKYYEPKAWNAYIEYDPERANQLLDEMGLGWNKEHTFRLRPDGEPVSVKIESGVGEVDLMAVTELVKGYWEAVGVKTDFDFTENFSNRFKAKKVMIGADHIDKAPDVTFQPGWKNRYEWWTPIPWYDAYIEGGRVAAEKKGVPEEIIELWELVEEFSATTDEEEKIEIAKEVSLLYSENLWLVGTVGGTIPAPCVVKNYLRNVPQVGVYSYFNFNQIPYIPAQFFISK